MILPKISKQQKHILYLLYKFRYLQTNQMQRLLEHKNPHRTQDWLKELRENGFIKLYKEPKTFKDHSLPYIYHLGLKARHILKKDPSCDMNVLSKVYKENSHSETFIDRCLTIADIYIFFQSQIGNDEELNFFTGSELTQYPFFPETNPGAGAYIALKKGKVVRRYFLEYFGKDISASVLRGMFQKYLKYARDGDWEANTKGETFPSILFVFALPRRKNHIRHYARGVLDNKIDETIELFITTKDKLYPGNKSIWEKV